MAAKLMPEVHPPTTILPQRAGGLEDWAQHVVAAAALTCGPAVAAEAASCDRAWLVRKANSNVLRTAQQLINRYYRRSLLGEFVEPAWPPNRPAPQPPTEE